MDSDLCLTPWRC